MVEKKKRDAGTVALVRVLLFAVKEGFRTTILQRKAQKEKLMSDTIEVVTDLGV